MILSVHATFGAAVASLVPDHPVLGFVLGFTSHFVLDAIPHRDYELISLGTGPGKNFKKINLIQKKLSLIRDVLFVSVDGIIGFILAFMFFFDPAHPAIFFIGAFAALIPDGLTFLYLIFKCKALSYFFYFHTDFIHNKIYINEVLGVILQFFTIIVLIAIIMIVKYILFL